MRPLTAGPPRTLGEEHAVYSHLDQGAPLPTMSGDELSDLARSSVDVVRRCVARDVPVADGALILAHLEGVAS